jgi:hypothetical protein
LADVPPIQEEVCSTTGAAITQYKLSIDPIFYDVCAPDTIELASIVTSHPCIVGGHVTGQDIVVRLVNISGVAREKLSLTLKLTGLRAGQDTIRFPRFSEKEWKSNTIFWRQATAAPDTAAALVYWNQDAVKP